MQPLLAKCKVKVSNIYRNFWKAEVLLNMFVKLILLPGTMYKVTYNPCLLPLTNQEHIVRMTFYESLSNCVSLDGILQNTAAHTIVGQICQKH